MDYHAFFSHPSVHGALIGLATAASVDLLTFKKANTWGEFATMFDFKVASFMWLKGLFFGALSGAGLNATFGI